MPAASMSGLTLGNADTLLTQRAADYLAAGPADPQALISHVCQLPGAPRGVAEHMAAALFAGHQRFCAPTDGRRTLRRGLRASEGPPRHRRSRRTSAHSAAQPRRRCSARRSSHDRSSSSTSRPPARAPWNGDRITEIAVVRVQRRHRDDRLRDADQSRAPDSAVRHARSRTSRGRWSRTRRAFARSAPQLLGVLEGHVFVAHNATFDWRFLSMEIERVTRRPLDGTTLCTVRLARQLLAAASPSQSRRIAALLWRRELRAPSRRRRRARDRRDLPHACSTPRAIAATTTLDDLDVLPSAAAPAEEAPPPPARASTLRHRRLLPHDRSATVSSNRASSDACAFTPFRPADRSSTAARCSASCRSRSGSAAFPPTSAIAFSSACAAC